MSYDSRTDAPRNRRLVLRTEMVGRIVIDENGHWDYIAVRTTCAYRPLTKRQARKAETGSLPVRPTLPQGVAFYEGFMDQIDVLDEQAIAEDGFDDRGYYGDWKGFTFGRDYDGWRDQGRKWTSESVRYDIQVAANLDLAQRAKTSNRSLADAKALRNQWIREEMDRGVRFPDLDPYTLEPIGVGSTRKSVSNIRPTRVRYF